jgi:hypothetical protein
MKTEGRPITITLHVDAATAVREGHCTAGPVRVRLDEHDFSKLDPDERDALARHLEDSDARSDPEDTATPRWGHPLTRHAEPIGHADFAVLRELLRVRAKVMAACNMAAAARELLRARKRGVP